MFSFAWPWMILLLALPVLVRTVARAAKSKRPTDGVEVYFPHIERLRAIFPRQQSQGKNSSPLHLGLLALLWLSLTAALMRPELRDEYTPLGNKGYDLMLAIDLSGSMQSLDYVQNGQPVNRLDIVKSVVSDFVNRRQGDRIGLLLFGSNAYLHVPLTLDTQSVRKMLSNTTIGEAGDATAIGDAIGLAVDNLRNRPENSRVIILMTDGGDNASTVPPLEAANLARQYGIRIYTIGVGTDRVEAGPGPAGQPAVPKTDLDETLLKKIADMTGGNYSRATDTLTLQQVYARIDRMEKTNAERRTYVISRPLYRYPLGVALAMLLLVSLLPVFGTVRHGF